MEKKTGISKNLVVADLYTLFYVDMLLRSSLVSGVNSESLYVHQNLLFRLHENSLHLGGVKDENLNLACF